MIKLNTIKDCKDYMRFAKKLLAKTIDEQIKAKLVKNFITAKEKLYALQKGA